MRVQAHHKMMNGREPDSDEELEAFAEEYILEVYNSGDDDL